MTIAIPRWLAYLCQVVGATALVLVMIVFAVGACWMASAETARKRQQRRTARETEKNIERAGDAMRFLNRYGDGFHAYGVDLQPGRRTRRTLAAIAADPLHRSRAATVDELIPHVLEDTE